MPSVNVGRNLPLARQHRPGTTFQPERTSLEVKGSTPTCHRLGAARVSHVMRPESSESHGETTDVGRLLGKSSGSFSYSSDHLVSRATERFPPRGLGGTPVSQGRPRPGGRGREGLGVPDIPPSGRRSLTP